MLMGRQYLIFHGLGQLYSYEGHDVYLELGGTDFLPAPGESLLFGLFDDFSL